jgi:hypothetical protein
MTTKTQSSLKYVLAAVGPLPYSSLKSATIALEIAAR